MGTQTVVRTLWRLSHDRVTSLGTGVDCTVRRLSAGITNSVGGAWTAPAYGLAGNMTTMPRPGTPSSSYTAVYDAWNRQVGIKTGTVDVQQYQYDARNFRTVILSDTGGVLSNPVKLSFCVLQDSSRPNRRFSIKL